jgi:hypothetical protein
VSIRLPSLCSIESGHPFVPTCLLAERRAQRQSRMPPRMRRHRRSRRKASLTERARCYSCAGGPGPAPQDVTRGYRPALFRLTIGGRSVPSSGESGANLIFGGESHRPHLVRLQVDDVSVGGRVRDFTCIYAWGDTDLDSRSLMSACSRNQAPYRPDEGPHQGEDETGGTSWVSCGRIHCGRAAGSARWSATRWAMPGAGRGHCAGAWTS